MILERQIQEVLPGCWEALEEIEKKMEPIESRHGYPPKRRYQLFFGSRSIDTLIVERDWPSLAEMEAHHMELYADPEFDPLGKEVYTAIRSIQVEVYMRLP